MQESSPRKKWWQYQRQDPLELWLVGGVVLALCASGSRFVLPPVIVRCLLVLTTVALVATVARKPSPQVGSLIFPWVIMWTLSDIPDYISLAIKYALTAAVCGLLSGWAYRRRVPPREWITGVLACAISIGLSLGVYMRYLPRLRAFWQTATSIAAMLICCTLIQGIWYQPAGGMADAEQVDGN